ncbi:hypothetical protein [Devosia sp.]|uniref:hypothetical protein n=1 Tax=Devosia sp. TaxID=1871048 RepID=UPI003BA87D08
MSAQQYSFQLNNDLEKIITITPTDAALAVRVVFARDVIVEETIDTIQLAGEFEAQADEHGLTIFYGHRPRHSRRY